MKKLTLARRLVASILAAMTLASTTAAFAETVVYENSFETSNGATTGLYVSLPEIKTYGNNLLSDGGFEKSNWMDNGTIKGLNQNRGTRGLSTEIYHSGSQAATYVCNGTNTDWTAYPFFTVTTPANITPGIYEFEGWFYTDIDGMNLDIALESYNSTTILTSLSKYGTEKGTATLNANEWTYVKATYSFTTAPTEAWSIFMMPKTGWKKADGTLGTLYMDDLKFRKVTNATLTEDTYQSGMPVYTTDTISGKTATARVLAANTTNDAKTFQLVTAVYDADGRFVSAIVNEPITVPANSKKAPYEVSFTVPELASGQYIKSFTWETLTSLTPLQDAKKYTSSNYLLRANMRDNAMIPNSGWHSKADNYTNAHGTDRVVNGVSRTGVNSFMVSSLYDTSTTFFPMVNLPVENGHTYRIEYYVNFRSYQNKRSDCIVGYINNDENKNGKTVTPTSSSYNGTAMATPSAALHHPTDTLTPYSAWTAGEWIKCEHTFTVTNSASFWSFYFQAPYNRSLQGQGNSTYTFMDHMYIDDFKFVDITETAE